MKLKTIKLKVSYLMFLASRRRKELKYKSNSESFFCVMRQSGSEKKANRSLSKRSVSTDRKSFC